MPDKEAYTTSRAKLQLLVGWGDDNPEEYKKWRRHIKGVCHIKMNHRQVWGVYYRGRYNFITWSRTGGG